MPGRWAGWYGIRTSMPGLRRHAEQVRPDEDEPGWDLVTTRFADVGAFADYVARSGQDAVVLDPPDLRDAVIARLKGVLA